MAPLYPHVACCIEDSPASRGALNEARRLWSPEEGGRLTLVHAAPWPLLFSGGFGGWVPDADDLFSAARRWLDQVAAEVPGAEPLLLTGYPQVVVCEWAEQARPDLLLAAAHRGLVQRAFLGGFASYLAYHAPCPVLLVRPPRDADAGDVGVQAEAAAP